MHALRECGQQIPGTPVDLCRVNRYDGSPLDENLAVEGGTVVSVDSAEVHRRARDLLPALAERVHRSRG